MAKNERVFHKTSIWSVDIYNGYMLHLSPQENINLNHNMICLCTPMRMAKIRLMTSNVELSSFMLQVEL